MGEPSGNQYLRTALSELILEDEDECSRQGAMAEATQHFKHSCVSLMSSLLSHEREEHVRQHGYAEHLESISDYDFFRHFRVRTETFDLLLQKFIEEYDPKHKGGREPIPAKSVLYVALWYLGNQDSYREIGEQFGMSEFGVPKCVQMAVKFFCNIAPQYIKWPSVAVRVSQMFETKAGFPGVIGGVDGCHIKVKVPNNVQADFIDRTSSHSVNLMAVCDAEKKFTFVDAGFPGSAHDTRVFKYTTLFTKLQQDPDTILPSNIIHIIGESGFQLASFLLVPYKDYGNLTPTELSYNQKLSQTRIVIEHTFGLLKGRFRRLKYLDVDLNSIPNIILSCCALHNMTMNNPDEEASLINDGYVFPPIQEYVAEGIQLPAESGGVDKRNLIASML